jgi:hypothetical protein
MPDNGSPKGLQANGEIPRWERRGLAAAFLIYILWQVNAVFHHGSFGQDFSLHLQWINDCLQRPGYFLTHQESRTNPPLFHYLASVVYRLTHGIHFFEAFALLMVAANAGGLFLLWRVLQQLLHGPAMRLACMVFVLFVPFAMIHAVVLAADSVATPLFLSLVYLFVLLTRPRSEVAFAFIVAGVTSLLVLGLAIKFTCASLLPAALLVYLVLYRTGHLSWKRAGVGVLAVLLFPVPFGWLEMRSFTSSQLGNLGFPKNFWLNPLTSPYMNLRSILWVKKRDWDLLAAPPYDVKDGPELQQEDGHNYPYKLLINNRYSYPGLLHLAMFTDLMNIYQYDPADLYFGPRLPKAQARMALAVKTSLPFSVLGWAGVSLMVLGALWMVARGRGADWVVCAILALFSLAFFLNIVLFFPFIPNVYLGGYWLPRLVVPALLYFFVLSWTFWDRLVVRHVPVVGWGVLLLVVLQSGLHLSFLWPWGGDAHPDRRFAQHQLEEHEQAIKLFEQEAKNGKDPALKQFVSNMLPVLREHQKMAKRLASRLGVSDKGEKGNDWGGDRDRK